jgi:hypothetical protein
MTKWLWALAGAALLVIGIIVDAAEANTNSTCASVLPGAPTPADCSAANFRAGVALVLIVLGVVALVIAIVLAVRGRRAPD